MIRFLDLQRENRRFADELTQVSRQVIESGWFLLGEQTELFEQDLSHYLHASKVISCSNGLDALRLIFRGYIELGVLHVGDEVIVPSNTFIASVLAITGNGLVPRFVDPNPNTYLLDEIEICKAISSKTKAILIVHLYGRVCWSRSIERIAKTNDLIVVEDNAQAIGAKWQCQLSGTLGDAAAFSFYPGKNLGALGDAGAIVSVDPHLQQVIESLRNYGSQVKYRNDYCGFNCRMDELQAAFLRIKLKYLDQDNARRRYIAARYCQEITNPLLSLPAIPLHEEESVWHLFVVKLKERERLRNFLDKCGVESLIHYPIPPHKQSCYQEYNHLNLPIVEQLANEILSLPIGATMTDSEVTEVINAINAFA